MANTIQELNEILAKNYDFQISIEGLSETMFEINKISDEDVDGLYNLMSQCQQWIRYLYSLESYLEFYKGMYDIKYEMLCATKKEADIDLKNGSFNSQILAKKCKIKEKTPEDIENTATWLIKTTSHEIKVFKKMIAECIAYRKFFVGSFYSLSRKNRYARNKI